MPGKNLLTQDEHIQALAEMQDELDDVKGQVDNFGDDLGDMSSGDMSYGDDTDTGDMTDEEKDKVKEIKTPEDAKKALEEAKKDIQSVSDNLDALTGQTDEEQKTAKLKRPNAKYATAIANLAKQADTAITDAKSAMKHWSYLLKMKRTASTSPATSGSSLKSAVRQIKEAKAAVKEIENIVKEGTAVPPTGADFSGDKKLKKIPREVEDRAWHAGANKFDSDLTWEHKRVNPAVDERLTDVEYNYEAEKPYVNATLHVADEENKYASYWDVFDTKLKQRMLVTFASIPDEVGAKDDKHLKLFASRSYGNAILSNVVSNGFEYVKGYLAGRTAEYNFPTLAKIAADSKSTLRKYYADAYGDKSYAGALASGENSDKSKMDTAYTPEESKVKDADTHTKDGPGTLSNQKPGQQKVSSEDKALLQAKATKSVELAKFAASRGVIPFTVTEIRKKAAAYFKYSDAEFKAVESTLKELPLQNEAALKEAHIPDVETGIVGNTKEGVRDPKATVDTEDMNPNVDSDAKIAKQASTFVPQANADDNRNKKPMFTSRVVDNLQKKGALNQVKKPNYKFV